ncbi:MAG: hypothetical protein IT204_19255 [Fimbriimonadaceae bacterium]|nr:hypothetical protein [Fimbriimonadaceae bacterium]
MRTAWLVWVCVASLANAATEGGATAQVEVGLVGNYVRRGELLGPAGAVASLTWRKNLSELWDFQLSASTYLQLDQAQGLGDSVYDVGVVVRPSCLGPATLALGWVYNDRDNTPGDGKFLGDDTSEFYVGLDFPRWPGRPWIYWSYDYDRGDGRYNDLVGSYVTLGAAHTWPIEGVGSFDLGARLGLDWGRGIDLYNDLLIRTAVNFDLAPGLTFGPSVDWWLPSHQVNPTARSLKPVLGCGFRYSASY